MQKNKEFKNFIYFNHGFTLVEKVIVIAIIGILSAFALPNYSNLLTNNYRRTALASFHHSIMLARNEAFTKGEYISICPSTDGKTCTAKGKDFSEGWISFVNIDKDYPVKRDQDERLVQSIQLKTGEYKLLANRKAFTVRPFRKRSTNGTLIFCPKDERIKPKAIIVSYIGRPRLDENPKPNHLKLCKT